MAFDLSWLWDLLNRIKQTIGDFIDWLYDIVAPIVNTGQGIVLGLIALGSQLWDAFIKGMSVFGEWLYKQFEWVYNGIKYWADVFGEWINTAFGWIGSGLAWLAQQFYNFGNWLYNLGLYVVEWVVNVIATIWNNILTWFGGVATAIGTWWASVIMGVNTWFTNLLRGFRTKIIQTIQADLTITMAWKGAERFLSPQRLEDFGYGLVGILASPIVGYLVGSIVDAVVPLPSSSTYPLIPDISGFAYTPTPISVPTPTERMKPEMGYAGQPTPPIQKPAEYRGLPLDVEISLPTTYDMTYSSTDKEMPTSLTVETDLSTTDGDLSVGLTYETEVT